MVTREESSDTPVGRRVRRARAVVRTRGSLWLVREATMVRRWSELADGGGGRDSRGAETVARVGGKRWLRSPPSKPIGGQMHQRQTG